MNVIDLFSGCGGFSKGLEEAGFNIVLAVDNWNQALETYKFNHSDTEVLCLDLAKKTSICEILNAVKNSTIDLVVAGPPCQGFSLTGPRKIHDPRNHLYLSVLEVIKSLKPKAFIIENVPGMATMYGGQVKEEIESELDNFGYNVKSKVLCSADYGVPQIRKRLFIIGVRKDIGFPVFPEVQLLSDDYITCEQAIGDLPSLEAELGNEESQYEINPLTNYQLQMRGKCTILRNHVAVNHKSFVKQTIALVPEGGNYKNLPRGVGESRKFNEAWTRYHSKKPSRTIDTGHGNHFHYKWNRVPTVRENARLQSFPDNYIFLGSRTAQYRQVGNAVPVLLAKAIGEVIKRVIES